MYSQIFKGKKILFGANGNTNPIEEFVSYNIFEREYRDRYWNIKPNDVVFDIGVDFGSFTLPALAMGAFVYAIEPRDEAISNIKRNLKLNGFKNIRIIQSVLYNKENVSCLIGSGGRSTVTDDCSNEMKTSTTTLDSLVEKIVLQRLDWIKIDVEGVELNVLKGGENTIRKFKPNIIVENHLFKDCMSETKIKNYIASLGLGYKAITEQDLLYSLVTPISHTYFYV